MKERPILFSGPMVRAILEGRKTQTRRVVKIRGELPPSWATFASMGHALTYSGRPRPSGLFYWSEENGNAGVMDTLRRWPILPPNHPMAGDYYWTPSPYGLIGDRLWVRETWSTDFAKHYPCERVWYAADDDRRHDIEVRDGVRGIFSPESNLHVPFRWRPSIHMPRALSRITIEIIDVRVERLQDISETDAIAEGALFTDFGIEPPKGSISLDGGRTFHPVVRGTQRNGWHMGDATSHTRCMGTARYAFANLINRLHGGENWNLKGPGLWESNPWVWVIEFAPFTDAGGGC